MKNFPRCHPVGLTFNSTKSIEQDGRPPLLFAHAAVSFSLLASYISCVGTYTPDPRKNLLTHQIALVYVSS